MVPFGGYTMPLLYSSIQAEHRAVRQQVGLFDLSHMGEIFCRGSGALAYLQKLTTNNVAALAPGQIQYSAMCYPDGGIVDDLLVYRLPDGFMLVVNAANLAKDWAWLSEHRTADTDLDNVSYETGMLAIQGPKAEDVTARMTDYPLAKLPFYHLATGRFGSYELLFSRTGYTGEDGFEIYCPAEAADQLWELAVEAGRPESMVPVGLGARDSLRLEMRYALYGHEIDRNTNPIAAGLGWICKLDKGEFIGREAILRMKSEGPTQKLVSLRLGARAIPREHYRVFADGRDVGEVRSGLFSPSLECGIATAYVESGCAAVGTDLAVQIRDRMEPAQVVKAPFYTKGSRRSAT
jgi:aminomethyltransferase